MLRTSIAQGPAPTVYLAGEMDLDCADTLREAVTEAARGAQMVALDFAGVEFIDSSGTGIFVRLALERRRQREDAVAIRGFVLRVAAVECRPNDTCGNQFIVAAAWTGLRA